jgi:hypothetical protein
MDSKTKTDLLSIILLAASILISLILYFVFHLVFIFVIFIPPVIYYFLRKGDKTNQ